MHGLKQRDVDPNRFAYLFLGTIGMDTCVLGDFLMILAIS